MTPLVDQADFLIQDGAAMHTSHGYFALEPVTVAMGAKLALAAVIARGLDFVLMRVCQQGCHANVEVRAVVVGVAIDDALAFLGEDAQVFSAVGEVIQKGLPGLPDRLTEFPGFDLHQVVLIGCALLIGFDRSAQRHLMARRHDGGWHG